MNIVEYLRYSKEKYMEEKQRNERIDDESTIEESISKIIKINEIARNTGSCIKYEIDF